MAAPAFVAADKSWLQIADASQSGLDPGTSDFSIALFVRPDSLSSLHYLWHKQVPGNNPGYNCYLNTNGSISVVFGDSVGHATSGTSAAGVIVAGSWHSIVVTFDRDGNAIVYVNGVSVLMLDISAYTGNCNNSETFLLATRPSAGFPFAGRLAYTRVWSRLLTAPEIARQANMSSGFPYARPYSLLNAAEKVGLVSAWELNEGPYSATQQALDSHGTNHLSFAASAIISPTVRNGGFETAGAGGADVFGSWTESVSGTSTINDEGTTVYAGAHACRLDIDASGSLARLQQTVLTNAKLYDLAFYGRSGAGTPSVRTWLGNTIADKTLSTSYAAYAVQARASATFFLIGSFAASNSIYLDSITLTAAEILTADGPEVVVQTAKPWLYRRSSRIIGGGVL